MKYSLNGYSILRRCGINMMDEYYALRMYEYSIFFLQEKKRTNDIDSASRVALDRVKRLESFIFTLYLNNKEL